MNFLKNGCTLYSHNKGTVTFDFTAKVHMSQAQRSKLYDHLKQHQKSLLGKLKVGKDGLSKGTQDDAWDAFLAYANGVVGNQYRNREHLNSKSA